MAFDYDQEIFGAVCSFFVLCVICVCALEVRSFVRRKTVISGRQLTVRLIGGVLLTTLLIKVLYGIYWIEYPHRVDADSFLSYWAACVLLAYICLILATIDLWLTVRLRRATRRAGQRAHDKLQAIAQAYVKPTAPAAPPDPPPTGDPSAQPE